MKKRTFSRLLAVLLALSMVFAVPVSASDDDVVIVLDPGHGGIDCGTKMTYDGVEIWESNLNLAIAMACRDYLEDRYENVEVLLTREVDEKVSLEERVAFADLRGADFVLSIHINADTSKARGALGIVPRGKYHPAQAAVSKRAAEMMLTELEAVGMKNRGTTYQLGTERYPDGSYVDLLGIIRGCVRENIPCVLMEHGFLTTEEDYREFLSTPEQLTALGRADAIGLAKTLDLVERKIPTSADNGDTPFEDIREGVWFYDDVTYVWEQGLMEGVSDTEFGPGVTANRAMVVTLLYRMDGAELETEESSFEDVKPGSWYHAPVQWALEQGITTGVSETEFAPGRTVVREQFVTFLHRYAGSPEPEVIPGWYDDWDTVSGYAENALAWAVEAGLVTGYEDGTVKPRRELNRAELAVLMHRFHRWLLHERGELEYEWTQSQALAELFVGESFELTLTNQYGEVADPEWTADCEGVVEIDGTTVTAVGEGTALLTCQWDGQEFECLVTATEKVITWKLSHTDVTIAVGESFNLRLKSSEGVLADVEWVPSKPDIVTISGSRITGAAAGRVTLSCEHEGETYECIVRVKGA